MTAMFRLDRCVLVFCFGLLAGCGRPLDPDSTRVFVDAERTFSQAKTPEEFLKAAAMDQEILDRGYVSGAVLYNQGNALMRAGQRGRAIAAYRRAQRYLGPDLSLEASLTYALGESPAARRRPVIEHLLFWQDWISYPAKFHWAALAVAVTFLLGVSLLLVSMRLLIRLTILSLGIALLLILSAAYDWYRFEWNIHGVIVEKRSIVRKGNAESYEPALTAPLDEGTEFEVIERRGEWLAVRLPGDQEGWVAEKAAVVF